MTRSRSNAGASDRHAPPLHVALATLLAALAASVPAAAQGPELLYEQLDSSADFAFTSQNFTDPGGSLDAYDTEAADDFVVPVGSRWTVEQIEIDGTYTYDRGLLEDLLVRIYRDGGGQPGQSLCTEFAMPTSDAAGDFVIDLVTPCSLTAGRYWISVQAYLPWLGGSGDQWYWGMRTTQANEPAHWRNPGGGWGIGCTSWGVLADCNPLNDHPDLLFALRGTSEPFEYTLELEVPTNVVINADGWPSPNPAPLRVRFENFTSAPIEATVDIEVISDVVGTVGPRFYAESIGGDVSTVELSPNSYKEYRESYTWGTLDPGGIMILEWPLWLQPASRGYIDVNVVLKIDGVPVAEDSDFFLVPKASIKPVVFVHGILGSMPPQNRLITDQSTMESVLDPFLGTYRPLLNQLQKMGYQWDTSLFAVAYDWRNSNRQSGGFLGEKIDEIHGKPVPEYVETDEVDLVVHSMGGLVSRSYIQGQALASNGSGGPVNYQDDVRKIMFLAAVFRGFPFDYRTWEGADWSSYMNAEVDAISGGFLVLDQFNGTLWPSFVRKRFQPQESDLEGRCEHTIALPEPRVAHFEFIGTYQGQEGIWQCPRDVLPYWSQHPTRGTPSLREMLPTPDFGPYLFDGQGNPEPFGVERNTFLESLNQNSSLLVDRLGADNIFVVYGDQAQTDTSYVVGNPAGASRPWKHGVVTSSGIRRSNTGDNLIPRTGANGTMLSIPASNRVQLNGNSGGGHKRLPFHRDVQRLWAPRFLTGADSFPYLPAPYNAPLANPLPWGTIFTVAAGCPVNLLVTDPQGRRLGYDPVSGEVLREIPNAIYTTPFVEGQTLLINEPLTGPYRITVSAYQEGDWTIRTTIADSRGVVPLDLFGGHLREGEVVELEAPVADPVFLDHFDGEPGELGDAWVQAKGIWDLDDGRLRTRGTREGGNGPWRQLLTTEAYDAQVFEIETLISLAADAESAAGSVHRADEAWVSFGSDASGRGGYSVTFRPFDGTLALVAGNRALAEASLAPGFDAPLHLKLRRDGRTGEVELTVTQGSGAPVILSATDADTPSLQHLGFGQKARSFGLMVDWVLVRDVSVN